MVFNLTPHAINIVSTDGEAILTLPPSGEVARVATNERPAPGVHVTVGGVAVPFVSLTYGETVGLPDPCEGVLLIVSGLVRAANPTRFDLVSPAGLVRDDAGRVIGCSGLTMPGRR